MWKINNQLTFKQVDILVKNQSTSQITCSKPVF